MGTQKSAQSKIFWFRKRFDLMKDKKIFLDKNKLLAQFCLDNASTKRYGSELLKTFETAGEIRCFGTEIGLPEEIKEEFELSDEEQEILT